VTISDLIENSSETYNVPADVITNVLKCESSLSPTAIGDNGNSIGIAQIDLIYHTDITREQAFDPEFSIDYLAREISLGNGPRWTCYRNLYPQHPQLASE